MAIFSEILHNVSLLLGVQCLAQRHMEGLRIESQTLRSAYNLLYHLWYRLLHEAQKQYMSNSSRMPGLWLRDTVALELSKLTGEKETCPENKSDRWQSREDKSSKSGWENKASRHTGKMTERFYGLDLDKWGQQILDYPHLWPATKFNKSLLCENQNKTHITVCGQWATLEHVSV